MLQPDLGALLMGPDGAFITCSDFLMDGGVTASYFYGELAPSERCRRYEPMMSGGKSS